MSTWDGWQPQLLAAAKLPTDEAHGEFLFDWSQHATADCANNPIDVSRTAQGSKNCHKLTGSRTAQRYASHGSAATAFGREINSGNFPALLAALKSPGPYQVPNIGKVVADLKKWGSTDFASYYQAHANTVGGGSGAGGGNVVAAKAHNGWHGMWHSIGVGFTKSLPHAQRNRQAALRELSRSRKVRI